MGCCGCSLRATAIFAAIFSLLQGSASIGLAIWGLSTFGCQNLPNFPDITNFIDSGISIGDLANAVLNIVYMVYFYNVDCEIPRPTMNVTFTAPAPLGTITAEVPWIDTNTPVTERTHDWMLAYTILSGSWIIASIILLIAAVGNKKGKGAAALYYPWILVMLAIVVADVTSTIIYFLDMNSTWGMKPFLEFIGINSTFNNATIQEYWNNWTTPVSEDVVFTIPSIIMGVSFSRFFVLWLMNLILLIYVLQAAIQVGKSKGKKTERYHDPQSTRTPNQAQSRANDQWLYNTPAQEVQARPISPNSRQDKQPTQRFQPQEPVPYAQQQAQQARQAQQAPPARASFQQQPPPQQQYFALQRPSYEPKADYQYEPRANHPYEPKADYHNEGFVNDEPIRRRFVPPSNQEARSSYQSGAGPSGRTTPTAPVARNESIESRRSNNPAPNELRSQLPWSYTQSRDDPAVLHVNKQSVIREEDEYLPPIPVPDYTLRFKNRTRGEPPPPNPKPQKSALKGRTDGHY